MKENPELAWNLISSKLLNAQKDFATAPANKREPVWFSAVFNGKKILINSALEKRPSSEIREEREISKEKFLEIYPFYFLRKSKIQVSGIVKTQTVNQVYIYGLIRALVDTDHPSETRQ